MGHSNRFKFIIKKSLNRKQTLWQFIGINRDGLFSSLLIKIIILMKNEAGAIDQKRGVVLAFCNQKRGDNLPI